MASRAYYSATLVAVRHLYILGRQLGLLNQFRPRDFDSETERFRRVPSRRTSKRRIFSQFLVFRLGVRRKFGAWVSIRAKAEDHTVARCKRAPHSKVCHSERFYREGSAFGRQASSPGRVPNRNFHRVQNMWKACGMLRLTGFSAALYGCKVSRTVGFAFVRVRLD